MSEKEKFQNSVEEININIVIKTFWFQNCFFSTQLLPSVKDKILHISETDKDVMLCVTRAIVYNRYQDIYRS